MGGPGSGRKRVERSVATDEMMEWRIAAARSSHEKLNPSETAAVIVRLADERDQLSAALKRILTVLDVEDEDADDLDTAVEAIVVVIGIANDALGKAKP
jgi:hypothetical protein